MEKGAKLSWTCATGASSYNLYWSRKKDAKISGRKITGITSSSYTHADNSLKGKRPKYYQLAAVDSAGVEFSISDEVEINITTIQDSSSLSGGQSSAPVDRIIDVSSKLKPGQTVNGVRVDLDYDAMTIPDQFQVIFDGAVIGDTGYVGYLRDPNNNYCSAEINAAQTTPGYGTLDVSAGGPDSSVTIRVSSPCNQTAWIWAAKAYFSLGGPYDCKSGAITVSLSPQEAIKKGALWSIDSGTSWLKSGGTVWGVATGIQKLTFKDVSGYTSPSAQDVGVNPSETATTSGAYKKQGV
jgi:hypothetical protein